MYKYIIVIGLAVLLLRADSTKAENKPKKLYKSGGEQKSVFHKGLVKTLVRPKTILNHHQNFSIKRVSEKKFSGDVLGYITPWNTDGLVNALQFAGKFSIYSPVWFRILRGDTAVMGKQDINTAWLADIRSNAIANSTVKILPRVLFESWTIDTVKELYSDIKKRDKMIRSLNDLAQKYEFDGYVLELWNQFLSTGVDRKIIIGIIKEISAGLKKKYIQTVLVIPPWRGFAGEEMFTKSNFNNLVKHVSFFSLMSYDYSSVQKPGPNAPLYWIKRGVEYLIPDEFDPKRRKILIGLQYYGYIYTSEGGSAVLGRDFIKYMKKHEGEIKWDDTNQEHYVDFKSSDPNLPSGMLFYPTLYSLKQRMDLAEVLHTGLAIWEIGQGLNYFFDLL